MPPNLFLGVGHEWLYQQNESGVRDSRVGVSLDRRCSGRADHRRGVTWDPDDLTDYTSQSVNMRQFINTTTGELTGFGIVTVINGTTSATFCASGCELTFQFKGFIPVGTQIVPGIGSNIQYTGGSVKFFADSTPDVLNPATIHSLTFANTGDGNLWLDLVGNGVNTGGVTFTGQAFGIRASDTRNCRVAARQT